MRTLVRLAAAAALMLSAAACHDQALITDPPEAPAGPERLPQEDAEGLDLP